MVILRPRSGESLVEAMLALVLLGVGLIPIAGLAVRSLRLLDEADRIARADRFAINVLDSLTQIERPASGARLADGGGVADWIVQPMTGATARIRLVVLYHCPLHAHADTFVALTGPWPRGLRHAP